MADVETRRDGTVLTVTLNRPDVLNAVNRAVHEGLWAAFKEAAADDVRLRFDPARPHARRGGLQSGRSPPKAGRKEA